MSTARAFYNEIDRGAAEWMRQLISENLISQGDVNEQSIKELDPNELVGFDRAHFFAGIGGWDYALKLAGWPKEWPVWTGSCPCQPFSTAGKRKGVADARHLWPEFRRLIAECRPPIVFGEQVASRDGRLWLDGVRLDLEALGYAVGAADLCSAGVGAPNIRQRLYWVAIANGRECDRIPISEGCERDRATAGWTQGNGEPKRSCAISGMDDTQSHGRESGAQLHPEHNGQIVGGGCKSGYWSNFDTLQCTDGKARRIEPGTFPLANGVPGRVGLLRGFGNAINPEVAAAFIRATIAVIAPTPSAKGGD